MPFLAITSLFLDISWLARISYLTVDLLVKSVKSSLTLYPQILPNQLTLSQPGGSDYAPTSLLTPPDFLTFRQPWIGYLRKAFQSRNILSRDSFVSYSWKFNLGNWEQTLIFNHMPVWKCMVVSTSDLTFCFSCVRLF